MAKTNFDVVVESLTPEILGSYMANSTTTNTCQYCAKMGLLDRNAPFDPCDYKCTQHTIEWLKKEVDET